MNAAEIKLDLFRRIDGLSKSELEGFYDKILTLLNSNTEYKLTDSERNAVEEAIADSDYKYSHTLEEVASEANQKYPNLKFK